MPESVPQTGTKVKPFPLGRPASHSSQAPPADPPALTAALALERLGLSVIALQPHSKRPLRAWKRSQEKRTPAALLRRWWRSSPTCGLGVVTGAVSGVIVLDVDGETGRQSLQGRHLPPTACAQTPRGLHRYFSLPPGVTLPRRIGLLPGVDLLGENSFAVAPPSHNGAGGYSWAPGLSPEEVGFAPAPEWLLALAAQKPSPRPPAGDSAPLPALPGELPAGVVEGLRNVTLARLCGYWLALGLSEAETRARARAWAETCRPPLPAPEALSVAGSIARAESRKPPGARGARIAQALLRAPVSWGAKVLGATWAALVQIGQPRPKSADLAGMLGVSPRTVARWRQELREAGLWETVEDRPLRRYATIRADLLTDPGLPAEAKATALALAGLSTEGEAQVGLSALCKWRGLSSRQVVAGHLKALQAAGYLVSDRAAYLKAQGRRGRCNRYSFTALAGQKVTHTAHLSRPCVRSTFRAVSEALGTPGGSRRARRGEVLTSDSPPAAPEPLEKAPWPPAESPPVVCAFPVPVRSYGQESDIHRTYRDVQPEPPPVLVTTEREGRLLTALRQVVPYAHLGTLVERHGLEQAALALLGPEVVGRL